MIQKNIAKIILTLQHQEVIAYPTEAVFGLGCNPDNEKAVNTLLTLKQRSQEKGLILVAANYNQLRPYLDDSKLNRIQKQNIFTSWPGAITWIIPASTKTPYWLTGRFNSLAVRVINHPLIQQLCTYYGKPIVSTSANLNGCQPCRNESEVKMQFGAALSILSGKIGGHKKPSEIRDSLTGKQIR
ncbi:L-threonylcarbamoyladenylate synthase type 1 TsaC [Candidatus Fukatsuia anoeciicola]|uniref:L-threonylcarbamoyladenylate synthase type 1 TsaC n=1 Tax=Candidatus Fukatsuia anoeciicola TaxID=2994492 RepID=UPI003464A8BC